MKKLFCDLQMIDALMLSSGKVSDPGLLWSCMVWSDTPQGHEFWKKQAELLHDFGAMDPEGRDAMFYLVVNQLREYGF